MPLKILVAEDDPASRRLLVRYLTGLGHTVLESSTGTEALAQYARQAPDLVILDIVMAEVDGIAAAREIRRLDPAHRSPIVFLTALSGEERVVEALQAGGDDYLFKPVSLAILGIKIQGFERLASLRDQSLGQADELARYYQGEQEEKRIGSYVMERLVLGKGLEEPSLHHRVIPAATFSGDSVAAARTPTGVLHLLMADAAGHGLASALNTLPMLQTFYAMTDKGFSIGAMAQEMNAKLKSLMPADRFVAALLAAVDVRDRRVEVWNGGMPEAFIVDRAGRQIHGFASRHLPLGVAPRSRFDVSTETAYVAEDCQLFLLSDGFFEASDIRGIQFGYRDRADWLSGVAPEQRFEAALAALDRHLGDLHAHDDVSLMVLDIPHTATATVAERSVAGTPATFRQLDAWRMEFSFGAAELKYLDVVPMVMGLVQNVGSLKSHASAIFLIVSELFNNAVDHGLLELDSAMKTEIGGFERYLAERDRRLEALTAGRLTLVFEQTVEGNQPWLALWVSDTGQGFDVDAVLARAGGENGSVSGRGLGLLRNLVNSLEFAERGATVKVKFKL